MNKLTTAFYSLAVAVGGLFCSCSQNQILTPDKTEPSYVAVETNSGRVLYSNNANVRRPIGMLANVATAVVVLDWVNAKEVNMDRQLTVPNSAVQWQRTNLLKLQPGDTISLRDALYSTVLWDDSACAATLAHACGEELDPTAPQSAFLAQMNMLADRLGMHSTYFKGVSGSVITQSSARDMALLAMYAVGNPAFLTISSARSRTVTVHSPAGSRQHTINNTNKLLGSSEMVEGLKAGSSVSAGSCLMVTARRVSVKRINPATGKEGTFGQRIVVVVLGMPNSSARYSNASKFLRDGWDAWEKWLPTNDYQDPTQFILLPN